MISKRLFRPLFFVFCSVVFIPAIGQNLDTFTCNSFDTVLMDIAIDTNSSWQVGQPNKEVFNSSYSDLFSIVTDLDSLYPTGDSSVFVAIYEDDEWGVPNYLDTYMPFQIDLTHRFLMDSVGDFGKIEMSVDNGNNWIDVLSPLYNDNNFAETYVKQHIFEATGDTLVDSLIIAGNSGGWVRSTFVKDINQMSLDAGVFPERILVRFTFISDSIGRNEGWQIDDLCLSMDFVNSISEERAFEPLSVFPNPNSGSFSLDLTEPAEVLRIIDLTGKEVLATNKVVSEIETNLPAGMYLVITQSGGVQRSTRLQIR